MTFRVLYRSRALHPFPHVSDLEILRAAWRFNTAHDLTGFLARTKWGFFQVLEGPEDVLRTLLDAIATDPLHSEMVILSDEPVQTRLFGDWVMAYAEDDQSDDWAPFWQGSASAADLIGAMVTIAAKRGGVSGRAWGIA